MFPNRLKPRLGCSVQFINAYQHLSLSALATSTFGEKPSCNGTGMGAHRFDPSQQSTHTPRYVCLPLNCYVRFSADLGRLRRQMSIDCPIDLTLHAPASNQSTHLPLYVFPSIRSIAIDLTHNKSQEGRTLAVDLYPRSIPRHRLPMRPHESILVPDVGAGDMSTRRVPILIAASNRFLYQSFPFTSQ